MLTQNAIFYHIHSFPMLASYFYYNDNKCLVSIDTEYIIHALIYCHN